MNDVIRYLYNHQRTYERERKNSQNDEGRGDKGERGDAQGEKEVDGNNEEVKKLQELKIKLIENIVRAYVHGLCAISLKATQALGDLHLVDKAEQSKKNDGKLRRFFNPIIFWFYFSFFFLHFLTLESMKYCEQFRLIVFILLPSLSFS